MAILGFVYLVLIFVLCFTVVHVIKLAIIGFRSLKKKRKEPEEKPAKKPEPVYYIVERKRARKSTYSEPKEIKFK